MADVEAAAGVFGVFRHGRIKPKLAVFVPHEVVRKVNLLGNVVVASKDLRVEVEPAFSVGLARAVVMADPWRDLAHISGRRTLRTLVVAGRRHELRGDLVDACRKTVSGQRRRVVVTHIHARGGAVHRELNRSVAIVQAGHGRLGRCGARVLVLRELQRQGGGGR